MRKAKYPLGKGGIVSFFRREKRVDLLDELVGIGAVNGARHLDALSAGRGASEAVHAYLKEKLRGVDIVVENVADDAVLCNFHFIILRIYFCKSIITFCAEKVNEFIESRADFGKIARFFHAYCEKITNCTAFFLCFLHLKNLPLLLITFAKKYIIYV